MKENAIIINGVKYTLFPDPNRDHCPCDLLSYCATETGDSNDFFNPCNCFGIGKAYFEVTKEEMERAEQKRNEDIPSIDKIIDFCTKLKFEQKLNEVRERNNH